MSREKAINEKIVKENLNKEQREKKNRQKRNLIKKAIRQKILIGKWNNVEKYIINIIVVAIFVVAFIFYNNLTSFKLTMYSVKDIQNFDISTDALKYIKNATTNNGVDTNKAIVMYARDNNYFAESSYIKDYDNVTSNKHIEKFKFNLFTLNKENKNVYNIVNSINNDVECLPFEKESYNLVRAVDSFNAYKNNYGTIFLEKTIGNEKVNVLSVSDGIVEKIAYNGDNGLQVTVKSLSGNRYIYANLSDVSVNQGSGIKSGEKLGSMGNTKQINDEVAFERAKLNFSIVVSDEMLCIDDTKLCSKLYVNPYPFLYLEAIGN